MPDITDILTTTEINKLRTAYKANPGQMTKVLSKVGDAYLPAQVWLKGLGDTVFHEFSSTPAPDFDMEEIDRERCLIALIAERRETLNLSVHLYMGMMCGLSPADMANVLVITGVYAGLGTYVRSVSVAGVTFTVLKALAGEADHGPQAVIDRLKLTFASLWGG